MMDEETKARLKAAGREDLLKIHEINQSGYAGVMPNGNIVDRREHPSAVPVAANSLMGIPEPKPLPGEANLNESIYIAAVKHVKSLVATSKTTLNGAGIDIQDNVVVSAALDELENICVGLLEVIYKEPAQEEPQPQKKSLIINPFGGKRGIV